MTEKIRTVKMIHLAICIGILVAYIVVGKLTSLEKFKIPNLNSSSILFLLIPMSSVVLGGVLYKYQVSKASVKAILEEKIPFYQTATIMRLAAIEAAVLLILFVKPDLILFGLLMIAIMFFLRPSEVQFRKDFDKI